MSAYDFTRPAADLIKEAKAQTEGAGLRKGVVPKETGAGTCLDPIGIQYRRLVLLQDASHEELKRLKREGAPTATFIDEVVDVIDQEVHEAIRMTVRNAHLYGRYEVLDGWYVYGYGTAGE